jgi:two-component system chemotaxis sensor kinase CheA
MSSDHSQEGDVVPDPVRSASPSSLPRLVAELETNGLANTARLIDLWEALVDLTEIDASGTRRPYGTKRLLQEASAILEAIALGTTGNPNEALKSVLRLLRAAAGDRATAQGAEAAAAGSAGAATEPATVDPTASATAEEIALAGAGRSEDGGTEAGAEGESDAAQILIATDPELLTEFAQESRDNLDDAEQALLDLETNPTSKETIDTIFRAFHTLKGVSAFLDLIPIKELAHSAESLLSRARDGEILCTGGYATLALRAVDGLRALIAGIESRSSADAPLEIPPTHAKLIKVLGDPERFGIDQNASEIPIEPLVSAAEPEPIQESRTDTKPASAIDSFVRVRTNRLDRLLDAVGELVIAQSMVAQDASISEHQQTDLSRKVAHAGKIVRELQDLSMSLRMVPLKATFQRMERVVRDVAQKSGKKVHLTTLGADTEIDRNLVDVLAEPLVHMVRNACDHGIEPPDQRRRAAKPEVGAVQLRAFHDSGHVVVELKDDGRGLDRDMILRKAVASGLVPADRVLSDEDVYGLIFAPGFSTAAKVTDVSGRGVGMDVVQQSMRKVKGRVVIQSQLGSGTTFSIHVPLTLAITDGMLVRVGEQRYIIPTVSISVSFRPERTALKSVAGKGELVLLRGKPTPVFRLHQLFGISGAVESPTDGILVVIGEAGDTCALLVDELLGQHQVVTKSLGRGIGAVTGVSGGAILGDGRVGLILDAAGFIRMARGTTEETLHSGAAA